MFFNKNKKHPGLYLGYFRGRSFPPQIYCYHYSIQVIILEKSSRRYKGSAHEVSIPCLKTLYDKFPGGGMPSDPAWKLGHLGLQPQLMNPRYNPDIHLVSPPGYLSDTGWAGL